jgi:hypothetical protein
MKKTKITGLIMINGKEFFGKTELTYELKKILANPELISHAKSEGRKVYFYIIGKKRQPITGHLGDIVAMLKPMKNFCRIHNSYLVNMNFVFCWCTHDDYLKLLLTTGEINDGTTIKVNLCRYDDKPPAYTVNGIDKYQLEKLLQKGYILNVSETFTIPFKKREKQFQHIKRLYQAIERKTAGEQCNFL